MIAFTTRKIAHLPLALLSRQELASLMIKDCEAMKASQNTLASKLIFSANGQGLSYYAKDQDFSRDMAQADLVHADGQSLVLFSRFTPGSTLPDRICTTDFFHDAAKAAEGKNIRFFFLGAEEEVNRELVTRIKGLYPNLIIAGRRNGYFEKSETSNVIKEIQDTQPDVVWVGLGRPLQEHFCVIAKQHLTGVSWLKTCGGLYDYITQRQPRAPLWMQNCGLEWLYRVIQEPQRLLSRYITTNFHALYLMLRHSDYG